MTVAIRIQIDIRCEGMEAWVRGSEGDLGDQHVLRQMIQEAGIRFGIDERVVTRVGDRFGATTGEVGEERIALGLAPEPGEPERLELSHVSTLQPGTLRGDGTLDYRERQLIIAVEEGAELGRIWPAKPGKPGMDVFGEAVPAEEPAAAPLKIGEGVVLDSAGILRAGRSGARTIAPDGMLDVVDRHVHPGNVSLASGSLRSAGSVEVGRDVETEMTVEAGGDIAIKGTVDGGCVRAEGSIQIGGGAIGRERGRVHAGGDLEVRHALGIALSAKRLLRVSRSVSASKLMAHEVEVGGRLLGDSVHAEARILIAGEAGSPAGGPCWLRAAYPLDEGFGGHRGSAPASLRPISASSTQSLSLRKGRSGKPSSHRSTARRSGRRQDPPGGNALGEGDAASEIAARIEWRKRQSALQETAVIEVRGKVHAGCRIDFGGKPRVLEVTMGPCRFYFDTQNDVIIQSEI